MFVVFDLDGTLSDAAHRVHFLNHKPKKWREFYLACDGDKPIEHTIQLLQMYHKDGHHVEIWSGRSDIVRDQTMKWLSNHGILSYTVRRVRMRKEGDHRSDVYLKQGWLLDHVHNYGLSSPDLVFDDRTRIVEMWRRNNIPCFQVSKGDF